MQGSAAPAGALAAVTAEAHNEGAYVAAGTADVEADGVSDVRAVVELSAEAY